MNNLQQNSLAQRKTKKQTTTQGRDGWEDGTTPPPHRDFKGQGRPPIESNRALALSSRKLARPLTLRCCPLGGSPPASSTNSTAERLGLAGGATRGLCCGHLGRSSGASQRLGRASFTHAATTGTSGPGVEPWCELHVRGGRGDSRSTRRTSKLAVGVLSWRERETAAEEPSAVASQKLPGSPSGGSCPF